MNTHTRFATVTAAFLAALVLAPQASAKETWVRVKSDDERVSVLFPYQPGEPETLSRKSPAGTITTNRAQYEDKGVLLTIAGTKLPGVALKLAGTNRILRNAAEGILDTYVAKEISQKKTDIGGEPAVVLEYLVPDYEDATHPGYRGIAIALLVGETLYVVNGILTREDPKSKAKQQKLLGSIQVHK